MEDKCFCNKEQNEKIDDAMQHIDRSNNHDVDSDSISDSFVTHVIGKRTVSAKEDCVKYNNKRRRVLEDQQNNIQVFNYESDNGCNIISSSNSTVNHSTDHEYNSDNDISTVKSDDDDDDDDEDNFNDIDVVIDKLRDCIKSYQTELRSIRFEKEQNICTSSTMSSLHTKNQQVKYVVDVCKSTIPPNEAYQLFISLRGNDGKLNLTEQLLHTYGYMI
jgi:hypothetical protein